MSKTHALLENICTKYDCIRIEDVSNRMALHLGHSGNKLSCSICFINSDLEDEEPELFEHEDTSNLYIMIVDYLDEETNHERKWIEEWLNNELKHGHRHQY